MRMSATDISNFLSKNHPETRIDSIKFLGEGLDNIAFEINGNLVVRFAKSSSGRLEVEKEVKLLDYLSQFFAMGILVVDTGFRGREYFSYRKIRGIPLINCIDSLSRKRIDSICREIVLFLSKLHSLPRRGLDSILEIDLDNHEKILVEATDTFDQIRDILPPQVLWRIKAFLKTPVPAATSQLVPIHNDIGIEHIIIDESNAGYFGIIDWTDAAVGDPAADLAKVYRDFGETGFNAILSEYGHSSSDFESIKERIIFLARCSVLEDVSYGRQKEHDIYLQRALISIGWLFPPSMDNEDVRI